MTAVRPESTFEGQLALVVAQAPSGHDRVVVDRVVGAFTDTIACMLAGADEDAPRAVHAAVGEWATPSGAAVVGRPSRLSAPSAALVNGTAAHALDYDDVLEVAQCHPSAVLVPAILALAEERHLTGAAAIDAYVAGFEVLARLGEVMNPVHYERGWHATSSLGAPAAAAACGRLLGLDEPRAAAAISLATSMAGGLKRQFGTMAKPLHAGLAAQAGVVAARMAEAGVSAAEDALTGERGFVECYAQPTAVDGATPSTSAVVRHGIWTKAFPSCASTHRGVDGVLSLRESEGFRFDEVEEITTVISKVASQSLPFDRPEDPLQAKFSMAYCVASALVDGGLRLPAFSAEAVGRAPVRALLPRVHVETYGSAPGSREPERTSVSVRTSDGRHLRRDVLHAPGSPARPMTAAAAEEKFAECAGRLLDEGRASEVFRLCQGLPGLERLEELTGLLMVHQ